MKALYLFLLLTLFTTVCKSQSNIADTSDYKDQFFNIIYRANKQPLVCKRLIWGKNDILYDYLVRDNRGHRTLITNIKPDLELMNLKELFDFYHIEKKYQNLPLKVDGYSCPHAILAVKTCVTNIVILTTTKGEKYINIITNNPPPPDAVM